MKGRPAQRSAEQGSVLVMLAITVFLFLSASMLYSSSQLLSARLEQANFGRNQAMLAAEAGIFTAFDTNQDYLVPTSLWAGAPVGLTFLVKRSAAAPPMTIASTGSFVMQGSTYVVEATASVAGGQILQWQFK